MIYNIFLFNAKVLAEAGVVPSKLSWKNSSNGCRADYKEDIIFFPDR